MSSVRVKIVGVGDSTTAGTPQFLSPLEVPPAGRGNPESQYAYWMMRDHPNWLVLNRGINGQRSDEILSRLERDVIREGPDYAVILAGVNDIYQGVALKSVEQNLLEMYMSTREVRIVPLAATVLPYNTATNLEASNIRALNSWIKTSA